MRRVLSVTAPIIVIGLVALRGPAPLPENAIKYDLLAFNCDGCERRLVSRGVTYDNCQKTAYAMNDGGDDLLALGFKRARKFECRQVR